jgi:class 3 adenylate cyclase
LNEDQSDVRRLSVSPVDRTFVYIDVSEFSRFAAGQQLLVIQSMVAMFRNPSFWYRNGFDLSSRLEAYLCIGDGYIVVFQRALAAAAFAARFATELERARARKQLVQDYHFRVGVHTGPVYHFWDPGRNKWNYVGEGINGGQRILSAIGSDLDDVVYVSSATRDAVLDGAQTELAQAVLTNLHNKGRHADKHGNRWRVYQLGHADFELGLGLTIISDERVEHRCQASTTYELHRVVAAPVGCDTEVVDRRDARMLQLARRLCLGDEPPPHVT